MIVACLLSGCASGKHVQVSVPVHVPCTTQIPERPAPTFGRGEYVSSAEAARAILSDYLRLDQYVIALEVQLAGCK